MTKKARLKKLLMNIFLLGMAGLLYGIFVSYLKVGDAYQNYLKTVWNIVSSKTEFAGR